MADVSEPDTDTREEGVPAGSRDGRVCGVSARSGSSEEGKPKKRDIMDGLLLDAVQTLEKPQLAGDEIDVAIAEVEHLASYNWTEEEHPTIIVPGSPRIWTNSTLPLVVTPHSGESFIDQNSFRLPNYPMLPIFEAIDTLAADATREPPNWSSIDVVTDRNNLLKLAGWADPGCSSSRSKKDFRIDIQLVGPRTVLLQRWEERTRAWTQGNYGDAFEKAATRPAPGCERATLAGTSRIISYDLAGLKVVVRFDVDACHPSEETASPSADEHTGAPSGPTNLSPISAQPSQHYEGLKTIRSGAEVPQSSLIKLKTRSRTNKTGASSSAEYLQLLLGQTPFLYVGIHDNGTFTSTKDRGLDYPGYTYSAEKIQPGLKKLRKLLQEIRDIAAKMGQDARLSLVCRKGDMQVMERLDGGSLLPHTVLARFRV